MSRRLFVLTCNSFSINFEDVAALFASLEQLKINGEVCKNLNTDATVTLISNFGGLTDDDQVSYTLINF